MLFTIIIPTYNRAHFLPKAIDSVLSQTFNDFELIVVDDGSSDGTKELIELYRLKDSRVRYIYQENSERSAARNNGIENAKGDYICFLDSDDYYLKNRLEKLYNSLKDLDFPKQFFYTAIQFDFGNGRIEERFEKKNINENQIDFLLFAVIFSQQVCIHRDILKDYKYSESFYIGEDMELWLRISEKHIPKFIEDQATIVVQEHEDRSVNLKVNNSGLQKLRLYNYIFSINHIANKASAEIKNKCIANAFFQVFKYHLFNQNRFEAIYYITRSIMKDFKSDQLKYKINLLLKLISFQSFKKILKII